MFVVIGGHSRKIGKTSVMAGIIAALPQAQWTAIKISADRHGTGPRLIEAKASSEANDTARYLRAGAARSYWLRASDEQLEAAVPTVRKILRQGKNTLVESNRLLAWLEPDLYLVVLDFTVEDFKESTRRFLPRADAFILVNRGVDDPPWKHLPRRYFDHKKVFRVRPPSFLSPQIVRYVANVDRMAQFGSETVGEYVVAVTKNSATANKTTFAEDDLQLHASSLGWVPPCRWVAKLEAKAALSQSTGSNT